MTEQGASNAGALKVCTVGAGYFSAFHHEAWAREPRVTLAAVCDLELSRAQAFADRFGDCLKGKLYSRIDNL